MKNEIYETIEKRFQSGNSVPVDSVRLTRDEWEVLKSLEQYAAFQANAKLLDQLAEWVKNGTADLSGKSLTASACMYRAAAEDT